MGLCLLSYLALVVALANATALSASFLRMLRNSEEDPRGAPLPRTPRLTLTHLVNHSSCTNSIRLTLAYSSRPERKIDLIPGDPRRVASSYTFHPSCP